MRLIGYLGMGDSSQEGVLNSEMVRGRDKKKKKKKNFVCCCFLFF